MLAIFLLKARRPEKYQGRMATGSGPIAVPLAAKKRLFLNERQTRTALPNP
jgi:hypothetical protein